MASTSAGSNLIPEPLSRKLRVFAFDPSVAAQFDMAGISEMTIDVPWERNLQPGPVGDYIEVIDADPASGAFYRPVDLNDPRVLAQQGLPPSETNPQFHQQMVYAVAMATIVHFERALGRVALWSSHHDKGSPEESFVRRLRIYPHALRDRNAFYSPEKKALLFGYFPVGIKDANNTPGTLVFTCLSHDIIAHETTHALLDGVHPRFNEPINQDVLAFHEAFADIVALFQHFSYPGVLRDQISRTRGNLANENLLGQLAQQFGRASGRGNALRDALGDIDPKTGKWKPKEPDVRILERTAEPHARGAILVAAVFGAFLKVYRSRTLDLYRIATDGTGVLREGDIHPDLTRRLADEAARTASYVLQMCIRGIDYCPPVGVTFSDYLRGVITADYDLNPDDSAGYRLAFVESFRQWGIHAHGARSTSVDTLFWPTGETAFAEMPERDSPPAAVPGQAAAMDELAVEDYQRAETQAVLSLLNDQESTAGPDQLSPKRQSARTARKLGQASVELDRYEAWAEIDTNAAIVWNWLIEGDGRQFARGFGLVLEEDDPPPTVFRSPTNPNRVAVEVHSVRLALRRGFRDVMDTNLLIEVTQRRHGYFDAAEQKRMDRRGNTKFVRPGDFSYRAGCTLIINPSDLSVRRVIKTAGTIADDKELGRIRSYLGGGLEPANAFDSARQLLKAREPFALLHRDGEA
ncbi:hypothetical protein [Mesorhizobium sp.]|uniref:hypothetical protein n=1 Tax=Mesorhizobium sp. TaxID=1871066 RepID=UPI0025BA5EC3|nr:hypothetical protein [Mesorhizobium sp.]